MAAPARLRRPMDDATIKRLADLAIGFGCNLQEGQIVAISWEPGK